MTAARWTRPFLLALSLVGACDCNATPTPVPDAGAPDLQTLLHGDDDLRQKLAAALTAKGDAYQPRTRHRTAEGAPKYNNRLLLASSPYLQQHAHNPVNWFPWGDEAFALAKRLGRPVFLSVGYSTCHWCHVMEEESFEDEEIARYLNEHYIAIKLDREERPDVDAIYMRFVQLLTQRGGWPMSVWLTPEREPFFGGTYFPARDGDRGVQRGFLTLLREQREAFDRTPQEVATRAREMADRIRRSLQADRRPAGLPDASVLVRARQFAEQRFDSTWGGARGRPKFPSSFPTRLLLRVARRTGDAGARHMALHTLQGMAAGGIYDHVGGGFHRYATDERWLVPHFEKMLYDNALLVLAYLEGYQLSGDAELARVAAETLDYVAREMTAAEGGFYSATDADSVGPGGTREEGYYFTWTPAELQAVLGEDAGVVAAYYGVTAAGNFEGRTVLHTPRPREEVAAALKIDAATLDATLTRAIPRLRDARNRRPAPLLDDKLQVDGNGLMISAMARGAAVLGEPAYLRHAERAAERIARDLQVGGRLRHSYAGGQTGALAFLDDHAFLAAGLLDLFETSQDARWLQQAIEHMESLERHHRAEGGGYYRSADDAEALLARELPRRDGAVPCGSSVALLSQLRLWTLTTDERWRERAEATLRAFSDVLRDSPWTLDEMLLGLDFYTDEPRQVLLVLPEGTARATAMPLQQVLTRTFLPSHVRVIAPAESLAGPLGALVPWARGKPVKGDAPTAYVCERGACDLPTTEPAVLNQQLTRAAPYPGPSTEP